ncbi:ABC transporter [Erythrobacter litoralis]|uniref:Gldg family protein n=1 Tax=Erythrobacter litoralis TaxID=39960 RepID=UPI0024352D52|nr:ABC transporter [Erythrobacter litoralis]MDG6077646.1 ABC transporter [Erythrobacter litoralis]
MGKQAAIKAVITALVAALLVSCNAMTASDTKGAGKPELGLFTTLPIYWSEASDITALLAADGPRPWVREAIEQNFVIAPLDVFDAEALSHLDRIVLAQPRPLAPAENVALDQWVREGGRTLMFADPMLHQHSIYPIGDKRRPQDVVLISPILARWGLGLQFDESQSEDERLLGNEAAPVPVTMAGELITVDGGFESECTITQDRLIARCNIGKGIAVIVADADLLDSERDSPAARTALDMLLRDAFRQ